MYKKQPKCRSFSKSFRTQEDKPREAWLATFSIKAGYSRLLVENTERLSCEQNLKPLSWDMARIGDVLLCGK